MATRETSLRIDPLRVGEHGATGFFVRAQDGNGKWQAADIAELDADSLHAWLRADRWSKEALVAIIAQLLGHEYQTLEAGDDG